MSVVSRLEYQKFLSCFSVIKSIFKIVKSAYSSTLEYGISRLTGLSRLERTVLGVSSFDLLLLQQPVPRRALDSVVIKRVELQLDKSGDLNHVKERFFDKTRIDNSAELETFCDSLCTHTEYVPAIQEAIIQLSIANESRKTILLHQETPFDVTQEDHVQLLSQIWINLKGLDEPIPSLTTEISDSPEATKWNSLGFQSLPHRDFRGSGVLGAMNLAWFTGNHPHRARSILREANDSDQNLWFPFAPTCLNITLWLVNFLRDGYLDIFFYNNSKQCLDTFNTIYSFVVLEFSRFWRLSRPVNILQFGIISEKFLKQMHVTLSEISDSTRHCEWSIPQISTGEALTTELRCWVDGQMPSTLPASRWIRRLAAVSV